MEDSDSRVTVCLCDHLTNFGIMFDYSGRAEANDPYLSVLSITLLVISSLCVLATQLLLMSRKIDNRASTRRLAENNRNWCLVLAQMSFVILAGQQENVSENVCQLFGIIIHAAYLAFFSWTGKTTKILTNCTINSKYVKPCLVLEGYFFYRALVTVFDTDRMSTVLHFIIGYGVPAIIILITTSLSLAGYEVYLRRDIDGNIAACFLSVDGMAAMATPAVLVAVINFAVTAIAIYVAHNATSRRSDSDLYYNKLFTENI